ncbi:MAG: hypothetical protein JRE28_13725 [Deltaproteobacteria bacterium]|nr:hypothetical protein [Deltaproteobacteria bacterium]
MVKHIPYEIDRIACKECGYTTCMAFAAALSKSETTPDKCPDFQDPISLLSVRIPPKVI